MPDARIFCVYDKRVTIENQNVLPTTEVISSSVVSLNFLTTHCQVFVYTRCFVFISESGEIILHIIQKFLFECLL